MTPDVTIRRAHRGDAVAIVETIRDGFDASLLGLFIYGCPGVENFVREQIAARPAGCDTAYTVACGGDRVVGCVEMRRFPGELFLNYISILSGHRSRDLGKHLLKAAIVDAREEGQSRLSLDVLEGNGRARRWYEALGFRYGRSSAWWEIPLPDPEQAGSGLVSGFPQAQATHREFGFSMIRIATARGDFPIGRLGSDWFRLTGAEALADPGVRGALRRVDPSRRVLAVLPGDGTLPSKFPGSRILATMLRMSADLEELGRRLP